MRDLEQHYGLTMLLEQNPGMLMQHIELIHQLESHLRLLAEAMLEAHKRTCRDCPNVFNGDGTKCGSRDVNCCQCEACKVAREVMDGLV